MKIAFILLLVIGKVNALEAQRIDTTYLVTPNTRIELKKGLLNRISFVDENKKAGYSAEFIYSSLLLIENYKNDTLHGAQVLIGAYGMPGEITMYDMGVRAGKQYHFWENGSLRAILNYADGLKEGVSYFYNSEGILDYYETYNNGLLNGLSVRYFDGTSIVEFEVNYLNGLENGNCTFYNEDGTVRLVKEYINGKLVK